MREGEGGPNPSPALSGTEAQHSGHDGAFIPLFLSSEAVTVEYPLQGGFHHPAALVRTPKPSAAPRRPLSRHCYTKWHPGRSGFLYTLGKATPPPVVTHRWLGHAPGREMTLWQWTDQLSMIKPRFPLAETSAEAEREALSLLVGSAMRSQNRRDGEEGHRGFRLAAPGESGRGSAGSLLHSAVSPHFPQHRRFESRVPRLCLAEVNCDGRAGLGACAEGKSGSGCRERPSAALCEGGGVDPINQ